ncbi:hypothetical protein AMEX_G24884 [Astyanax mexicanus]|uniref:Uncharacterized protein n=1 Tax=Astyanax mexicanus TaxID=7994 RepID=A0A8T2KRX2_ASTMX|nr:hypothetical protein AMEX_G24884 [Astyanax mexicanus]
MCRFPILSLTPFSLCFRKLPTGEKEYCRGNSCRRCRPAKHPGGQLLRRRGWQTGLWLRLTGLLLHPLTKKI